MQPAKIINLAVPAKTLTPVRVCGAACARISGDQRPATNLSTQIKEFFSGLLDTRNWPARWHCGSWSDFHGWLYIASDLLIWLSYFIIPVLLVRMLLKRTDIPFPKIVWLFGAFIVLCGTTHFLDAVIFWWPAYRLSALIRFLTAIVSVFTVYALYKIMPLAMGLRTVTDLEKEIKERKLVEAKLAESEFLLNEAGRIGQVGGWEFDVLQQRSTWSKTVYDIYNVPYDFDVDGTNNYDFYTEGSAGLLKEAVERAYADREHWDLELQLKKSGGIEHWVRSCGECVTDNEGRVVKLRGVFMDITRYKITEQSLSHSHELLLQTHQQLRTFTHILSHNIRNHASNISLLTDMVDTNELNEDNQDLFEKLRRVSDGLNDTLNDLAEAIKIREQKIRSEALAFEEITEEVVAILDSEMVVNGAKLTTDFKEATINFPGIYLESIILNLLSNAVKYRKPDVPPVISLKTYKNTDNRIVLECRDNGLGIDLDLHGARLFGLYKTFHAHDQAHGVGLFLVKTQVESQGGEITVESRPGEGSTFKIIF